MEDRVLRNGLRRSEVQLRCEDESRTKQSMKDDCDINLIVSRYVNTGVVTHVAKQQGYFGDCPSVDFQTAMNTIRKAEEAFDALPSRIRNKFANNPAEYLKFIEDPDNLDECVKLGLMVKKVDEAKEREEVITGMVEKGVESFVKKEKKKKKEKTPEKEE